MASSISFSELQAGASVRYVTIQERFYFCVRDLIIVICNQSNKDASQTWLRLRNYRKTELSGLIRRVQFPGRGQSEQPVIEFQGALKLIMWLPGEHAKNFRSVASDILNRVLTGDTTLIKEIKSNKLTKPDIVCSDFLTKSINTICCKRKREHITRMPESSWVYGSVSDAFPGLVKIGRSVDPSARLSSGNTFCAPEPHRLVAAAPTLNSKRDETRAHRYFSEFRIRGEFFRVSESAVRNYFTTVITPNYQQELNAAMASLEAE